MIKVYATVGIQNNLITTIPFKGVKVRVEFTGGNSMKNIPAKLYTSDPFTQKALDESDQNGRLYFLKQVIEEDSDKTGGETADKTGTVAGGKPATGTETATDTEAATGTESAETGGSTASVKLEFENLAEAINYIASKYGEQVETEAQARKFLEEREGKKCIIHKG